MVVQSLCRAKILYFISTVWMLDQSSIFIICKFVTFQYKSFEVQYESWDIENILYIGQNFYI